MSEKHPITAQGYEKIQQEIKHIISVLRPQNIREIEEARAHGDLKENAEYHAAKDRQGMIEARLQLLNEALATSQIIDISKNAHKDIRFGAKVSYINLDTEEESEYLIVGKFEADIKQNKISIDSPIGRALLGKNFGDEVDIVVPKGKISVEITNITY